MGEIMSVRGRMPKRKQSAPQRRPVELELDEHPLVRPESAEAVGARMDETARNMQEQKEQHRQRNQGWARDRAVERAREQMRRYNEATERLLRMRGSRAMARSEPSRPPSLESVPRVIAEPSAEARVIWQTGDRPARRGRIDGVQRPVVWTGAESGPVAEPVAEQAEEPSDAEVQANEEEEA